MFWRRWIGGEYSQLLHRYRESRKLLNNFQQLAPDYLHDDALSAASRYMGMLSGRTIVCENEHEVAVLVDHCMYDVRSRGATAVERFVDQNIDNDGPEQQQMLRAMREARFRLLRIVRLVPAVGFFARDELWNEDLFVAEINLSRTAHVGALFAARTLDLEEFHMTTGAGLPVTAEFEPDLHNLLRSFGITQTSEASAWLQVPRMRSKLNAAIIRFCLSCGMSERMETKSVFDDNQESRDGAAPDAATPHPAVPVRRALRAASAPPRSALPGSPCPCGSGRIFKKCCAKRHVVRRPG